MNAGRHRDFLPTALGVFALVAAYGIVNDQAIAAIAPQHFTIYHPHYFPFEQPWAQALCFGLIATGGPGLAWGIMLYWVGHYGKGPPVSARTVITAAAIVVLVTALISWGLGWRAYSTQSPVYPEYFYPSQEVPLYISQTVQLTNYLVGLAGAMGLLAALSWWRSRLAAKAG